MLLKRLCRTHLNCFYISLKAAKLYMHAMVFSHLSYCVTVWSQVSQLTIKAVRSLYKQTLTILDKKPNRWHHCNIVQKYSLLSFENCIIFSLIKMVFKCVNNLAPEIICPLISKQSSKGITTRGATNQNCTVPKRKTKFAQSTFSVQGTLLWNSLPAELKMQTELHIFQRNLKKWFKQKQVCEHWWSYTVSDIFFLCDYGLAVVKKA